jgi:hypothetical protein
MKELPMITTNDYALAWATLTEAMNAAANENDLCDTYDYFVRDINKRLPVGLDVPVRMKTYEVSFTIRLTDDASECLEGAIDQYTEDECDTTVNNFEMSVL